MGSKSILSNITLATMGFTHRLDYIMRNSASDLSDVLKKSVDENDNFTSFDAEKILAEYVIKKLAKHYEI